MNTETKESFFSKTFGYKKDVGYKPDRHMSLACEADVLACKKSSAKSSRKFSVPLLKGPSLKEDTLLSNLILKTKKIIFLNKIDEKSEKFEKRGKKGANLSRKKSYKGSPQGRIVCHVSSNQPLEYPATPELILEHHRKQCFLKPNEEWVLLELNQYECLVESLEVVKMVAKHSKFFEVDPEVLWEEFFEFVEDVVSYDDVVNEDVWQEFRDKKYVC